MKLVIFGNFWFECLLKINLIGILIDFILEVEL